MKLAVSNIAWPSGQDEQAATILTSFGITGLEIAPTKVWPNPLAISDGEADDYRGCWAERGIAIVAAQALLFGKPHLALFGDEAVRNDTIAYLGGIVRLCGRLGAGALVFGSPKNRLVGNMPRARAMDIAIHVFRALGAVAVESGTCIVLEANPKQYGADFITRAGEAIELVKAVDHPGFQLHLDTGCMTLAGDSFTDSLAAGWPVLRHFHVSERNLDSLGSGTIDHTAVAAELARRNYAHWVSLEMREGSPFCWESFAASIQRFSEWYH